MNKVATMEPRARAELFAETAARLGVADAIVEKDFWVCWVLKQLFSNKAFEGRLLFKGGTSLSKIYQAINRFSEDIDLAVDYVALGFTGDKDPRREDISKTKRNAILDEMMETCRGYIASEFLETLRNNCSPNCSPVIFNGPFPLSIAITPGHGASSTFRPSDSEQFPDENNAG